MKVQVKVVMNAKAINEATKAADEAKALNQRYANQRSQEAQKPKNQRTTLIPEDIAIIEAPEKEIVLQPMLLDASGVKLATIGDAGMIEIMYEGRAFNVEYEQHVWDELEKRFDETQNRVYATAATSN